jgi:transposase InsO family protein
MKVSRSSYYEWLSCPGTNRENQNKELSKMIKAIFTEGRGTYGTRRIARKLAQRNVIASRRRIGQLMAEAGLACKSKRKFKATTDSKHSLVISPNLLERQFAVTQPNRCWVGDITYIPTEEGWLYLAVVIDLYSRQIVGWSMDSRMQAKLVNDALTMALWKRKPPKGLIWHTDRGSQYASASHREILGDHAISQSMSRKGNCWDNAVAESFFHTAKTELTHHCKYKTRKEAKHAIFEYIEVFYNRIRTHSANDYLSPVDYETLQKAV